MKNMESMNIPLEAKLQSAFVAHTSNGGKNDPNFLVETAEIYLEELAKDKTNFEAECDKKQENEVGSLTSQIGNLNSENIRMEDEIENLRKKIASNNESIAALQIQVDEKGAKILNSKVQYQAANSQFEQKIQKDIANIKTYLINQKS